MTGRKRSSIVISIYPPLPVSNVVGLTRGNVNTCRPDVYEAVSKKVKSLVDKLDLHFALSWSYYISVAHTNYVVFGFSITLSTACRNRLKVDIILSFVSSMPTVSACFDSTVSCLLFLGSLVPGNVLLMRTRRAKGCRQV